jgi:hypothetical protein
MVINNVLCIATVKSLYGDVSDDALRGGIQQKFDNAYVRKLARDKATRGRASSVPRCGL